MEKTYTVERIEYSGKWMEFWFSDFDRTPITEDSFHECCKTYMFWELMEENEISESDIMNKGIKGMKLTWEGDRPRAVEYN